MSAIEFKAGTVAELAAELEDLVISAQTAHVAADVAQYTADEDEATALREAAERLDDAATALAGPWPLADLIESCYRLGGELRERADELGGDDVA